MRPSPGSDWRRRGAFASHGEYRKFILPNVICLTFGHCQARLDFTRGKQDFSNQNCRDHRIDKIRTIRSIRHQDRFAIFRRDERRAR